MKFVSERDPQLNLGTCSFNIVELYTGGSGHVSVLDLPDELVMYLQDKLCVYRRRTAPQLQLSQYHRSLAQICC